MNKIDCCGEFGYELMLVIPYAYFLHKKHKLESTVSSKYTKELYYFNNRHKEKYNKRRFQLLDYLPNKTLNSNKIDLSKLVFPEYSKEYKNIIMTSEKPFLIIHNKYTMEWGRKPVNYINIDTLEYIFKNYANKYKIIYSRLTSESNKDIAEDDQNDYSNKEFEKNEGDLLRKYKVERIQDMYSIYKEAVYINNFNHFQLLLHANCKYFISVQGGTSALASYFKGKNLIYARSGSEVCNNLYQTLFKKVSDQDIYHVRTYEQMIDVLKNKF